MVQEPLRIIEDRAGQPDRLSLVVTNRLDNAIGVDLQNPRAGHGKQDRRMRSHHKLAALCHQVPDPTDQGEAPLRRQRRFRLIEQIQPIGTEPVDH